MEERVMSDIKQLAENLRQHNKWRRGAETEITWPRDSEGREVQA